MPAPAAGIKSGSNVPRILRMARFIPDPVCSAAYITLLKVGFDTIYVVLQSRPGNALRLAIQPVCCPCSIVAEHRPAAYRYRRHERGVRKPAGTRKSIIRFPFSVSETFGNTNVSMTVAAERVRQIPTMAMSYRKALGTYISMAWQSLRAMRGA